MTDMQTFWNMLERKRQQLELEGEQSTGPAEHVGLPESIALIQLELRDLMSQVSSQVASTFTATTLTRSSERKWHWGGLTEQFLFSLAAEPHSELLDGVASPGSNGATASPVQLWKGLGQPRGGLHYSEGSRPLPRQASEGLPAAGVADWQKSALRKKRSLKKTSVRRQNSQYEKKDR